MSKKSTSDFDVSSLLSIGFVLRAHGILGELKISVFDQNSSSIQEANYFYLQLPSSKVGSSFLPQQDGYVKLTRKQIRNAPEGIYLVKFEEIHSRTEAEMLEKAEVFVSKKELSPLAPDEFFFQDLVGFQVFQHSKLIGSIKQVLILAGQELLSISGVDEQEILIPFHPHFIIHLDQKEKTIEIDPPEGLLELNNKTQSL